MRPTANPADRPSSAGGENQRRVTTGVIPALKAARCSRPGSACASRSTTSSAGAVSSSSSPAIAELRRRFRQRLGILHRLAETGPGDVLERDLVGHRRACRRAPGDPSCGPRRGLRSPPSRGDARLHSARRTWSRDSCGSARGPSASRRSPHSSRCAPRSGRASAAR